MKIPSIHRSSFPSQAAAAARHFIRRLSQIVLLCWAAPALVLAQPQAWPARPIHLVVPFPAGTAPDAIARALAESLAQELAVPVVVENQPGASGTVGVGRVARAAGDGYTLVLSGDAAIVGDARFGVKLPYDPAADLVPVSQIAVTPNILVIGNDVPARTVQELVALVRSQPWGMSYASVGYGTSSHRSGELLSRAAGLDMVHVPGNASPLPDVIGGRISMFFANAASLPLVREGKLRALAVSSRERLPMAPELPTMAEAGFPSVDAAAWFALFAPKGTPSGVVARLEEASRKVVAGNAALRERLQGMGAVPVGGNAESLARLVPGAALR